MEIDDLKPAWHRLERELRAQQQLTSALLAERATSRVEDSLKPLFNWQVIQIIVGVGLAALAGQFWVPRVNQELLLASGIVVHIYGIALIIAGVRVVMLIRDIDYAEPVTVLQKRIARLERSYIRAGWILGLPWWLLWIPVALMFLTMAGIDLSGAPAEKWLPANIVVGVVGMVLTVAGFKWAQRSSRPGVRARIARMVSGASIDRAKRLLGDIERFEREGA